MDVEDARVWDRWLALHRGQSYRCSYDVPVGSGRAAPDIANAEDRVLWQSLTIKRVDVVVTWSDETWVVEVKPLMNFTGLGQVLGYTALFRSDHPDIRNVTPVLVCGGLDNELVKIYESNKIIVHVV